MPRNSSVAQTRARQMAEAAKARGIQVNTARLVRQHGKKELSYKMTQYIEVQNMRPRVTREHAHSTTMRVPDQNHRFSVSSYTILGKLELNL